jgi:hypothetical protein
LFLCLLFAGFCCLLFISRRFFEQACRQDVVALVSSTRDAFVAKIKFVSRATKSKNRNVYPKQLMKSQQEKKAAVSLRPTLRSSNKVAQPRLAGVRWRISVCISSATCSRILRPFVLLEITLSNGSIRTMEMSVDKFNELRFSVAQVCWPCSCSCSCCVVCVTLFVGFEIHVFARQQSSFQVDGSIKAALVGDIKVNRHLSRVMNARM